MSAPDGSRGDRLSTWRLMAFSVLGMAIGGVQMPLMLYLPPFYAGNLGLDLSLVGTLFMVCRLWNAGVDPVVGALSDRTRLRFGRRKPFIAIGAVPFFCGIVALFMPPAHVGGLYLALWLIALYLGFSMVSTPLYAWSGDLAAQYHERTRIQTFLQTAASLGLVLILLIPMMGSLNPKLAAHLPASIPLMGWFLLAVLAVGTPLVVLMFQDRPAPPPIKVAGPERGATGVALMRMARSGVVLRVIGSDFCVSVGQGFRGALFVFFLIDYMKLPASAALFYPLLQYVFGVFASPLWWRIGKRFGKHRTVVLGEITQVAANFGLLFLAPGDIAALVALTVAQGLSQGSGNLMLRAIVSDVADEQRLATGSDHSGFLFSIFNVTYNAGMALAVGMAFPLVASFGFHHLGTNTPAALQGLQMIIAFGPSLGHAASALIMWRFPLDERRHAEIAAALRAAEAAP